MTTVAELLTGSEQEIAWILVIEGLPYVWTTDGSGDLWGTDWWGSDGRTVKPGLHKVPDIRLGLSLLDGQLEDNGVTFTITDVDGSLAELFGKEPSPEDVDILAEDIDPNEVFTVSGDVNIQPLTDPPSITVDVTSKHIGVEKISAAGGRSSWLPWPVTMPGRHHVVDSSEDSVTPQVPVSDDPIVFEGRRVALYKVVKDIHDTDTGADAWRSWSNQFDGGALQWWGVLLDKATIKANREWRIRCAGPEGLLQGRIGESTVRDWLPVSGSVDLGTDTNEDQTKVALALMSAPASLGGWYESALWAQSFTGTTGTEIFDELQGFIEDVIDGTTTNVYASQDTFDTTSGEVKLTRHLGFNAFHLLAAVAAEETVLFAAMHEKAWKVLGFEPALQGSIDPTSSKRVEFAQLGTDRGDEIMKAAFAGSVTVTDGANPNDLAAPGSDYWVARLSTKPLYSETPPTQVGDWDNDFKVRILSAVTKPGASIVSAKGGQELTLATGDHVFLQGQLFLPPYDGAVDGTTATATRLWLLRGKFRTDAAEEAEDLVQVAKVSWVSSTSEIGEGNISFNSDGLPVVRVDEFRDPRAFGLPYKPLGKLLGSGYWASHIEALPLSTLAYTRGDRPEVRYLLLMRLLLSTGSSTGWSSQTAIDDGDNTPDTPPRLTTYAADREIASLGLAVPEELVADEQEFRDAFDTLPGGWEGPLNRVRLAWAGPLSAVDLIRSLMATAGVAWRLHGNKYGVFPLYQVPARADVEVTLTMDDVEGPPSQESVTYGRYSEVQLEHAWNPVEADTGADHKIAARDRSATNRPNKITRQLEDWGLPNLHLWDGIDGDTYQAATGIERWDTGFREFWGERVAGFLAQRNFPVTAKVRPHKGHLVWPGTIVQITSPWLLNPVTGSYGVTNGISRCLSLTRHPDGSATVELLVYGETLKASGPPHYAPIALTGCGYDPSTRTLHVKADWRVSGDDTVSDVQGMVEPSWSTLGGGTDLELIEVGRDGTWTAGPTGTVESVDEDASTITFESPGLTGYRRDATYFVVHAAYASSTTWAQTVLGVVTDAAGGNGANTGREWLD